MKAYYPLTTMIFIGLFTAIGSEIKILPFEEASFRFGLGSIIFFLGILIRPVPILKTGFITAFIVWIVRTGLQFTVLNDSSSIHEHLPAALFYIVFACCLQLINVQQLRTHPFQLGLYGALFEMLGNITEWLVSTLFFTQEILSLQEFALLIAVAFLRSYFVIGLFSTLAMSEQKKRTEQLLTIGSDLYVETLYMQKSMENIERITADGYHLYKELKEIDTNLSLKALMLSQEIHEVKKDSERIYAGLSKIVTAKREDTYELVELLKFIFEANAKYAESLRKDIYFDISWQENFQIKEHIVLLAMLNNIIANAIEAIEQRGWIHINVESNNEHTLFTIENNGPPIPHHALPILFDPGYTTKFNEHGYASTGIGLSHVQTIVQRLEGSIDVTSDRTTQFKLNIPTYKLR